ncbi:hypothetical protein [Winogradskyella sp. KYW1333]|uniref:capsular polysaccharide export protein, LipB/KpsS family n=1 Tax=Winogradskyella sp. KYW1333 TaxID=2282123 RepID=UPI0015F0B7FE|nr:hypothetical protein [Winogradskyella sp. KYW1333]
MKYKSIQLYDVAIYNICNDLGIFKDELSLEVHIDTVKKWFSRAINTIDYLEKAFEENDVAGALIFHGHLLFDACLLEFCRTRQTKFLTLELTANKNKIVWDNISGFVVTYNLSKNFFDKYIYTLDENLVNEYVKNYIENIHSVKREEHSSNTQLQNQLKTDKPYILFLGQVYNDASQLFTIENDIGNPVNIIYKLEEILNRANLSLVVKLHPKEINGRNPVTQKLYDNPTYSRIAKNIKSNNIHIDSVNQYDTFQLIKNSKAVVTLNSQAGLEASLFNKPIFCYYKGFYSNLGFTNDYSNLEELESKLLEFINDDKAIKNELYAKGFFYIFFEKYCFELNELNLINKVIEIFNLKTKKRNKLLVFYKKQTQYFKYQLFKFTCKARKMIKK